MRSDKANELKALLEKKLKKLQDAKDHNDYLAVITAALSLAKIAEELDDIEHDLYCL